jgi:hypothetical protein
MLVSDLIAGSLRLVGRLGPGRTAGPSEQAAAFLSLNGMLDEWATKRLMVYQTVLSTYTLTANTQIYQIGPSATSPPGFITTRPSRIETANIVTSGVRFTVKLVTADEYSQIIRETGLTGQVPQILWDDMASPNSNLYVWPIPSGTPTLELFTWQPISQFATVGDTVALPPGFYEALRFNLGVRFASEVGKPVPPQIAGIAQEAIRQIERLNKIILDSRSRQGEIDAIEAADITGQPAQAA